MSYLVNAIASMPCGTQLRGHDTACLSQPGKKFRLYEGSTDGAPVFLAWLDRLSHRSGRVLRYFNLDAKYPGKICETSPGLLVTQYYPGGHPTKVVLSELPDNLFLSHDRQAFHQLHSFARIKTRRNQPEPILEMTQTPGFISMGIDWGEEGPILLYNSPDGSLASVPLQKQVRPQISGAFYLYDMDGQVPPLVDALARWWINPEAEDPELWAWTKRPPE